MAFSKSKSEQSDRTGILEVGLGKTNSAFTDEKIDESAVTDVSASGQVVDVTAQRDRINLSARRQKTQDAVAEEDPIVKVLKHLKQSRSNRKKPTIQTRQQIVNGIKKQESSRGTDFRRPQKPLVKKITRRIKPKMAAKRI